MLMAVHDTRGAAESAEGVWGAFLLLRVGVKVEGNVNGSGMASGS